MKEKKQNREAVKKWNWKESMMKLGEIFRWGLFKNSAYILEKVKIGWRKEKKCVLDLELALGRRSNAGCGSAVIVSSVDLEEGKDDISKFNIEKSGKKVVQKGQSLF